MPIRSWAPGQHCQPPALQSVAADVSSSHVSWLGHIGSSWVHTDGFHGWIAHCFGHRSSTTARHLSGANKSEVDGVMTLRTGLGRPSTFPEANSMNSSPGLPLTNT